MTTKKPPQKKEITHSIKKPSIPPKKLSDKFQATKKKTVVDDSLLKQITKALQNPIVNSEDLGTILHKVDAIEKRQGQQTTAFENLNLQQIEMGAKVDAIHEAMYDPDKGLFARIKATESLTEVDFSKVEVWREFVDEKLKKDDNDDQQIKKKIDENEKEMLEIKNKVEDIIKSRKNTNAIIKWVSVAIGSSVITTTLKILYDVLNITH